MKILQIGAIILVVSAVCLTFLKNGRGSIQAENEDPSPDLAPRRQLEKSSTTSRADQLRRDLKSKHVTPKEIPGPASLSRLRGARNTAHRPKYPLFGHDLILTRQIVLQLNLSDQEAQFLQESNELLLESVKQEAAKHLKVDTLRQKPEDNIRAFLIEPFSIDKIFDVYSTSLEQQFGREAAGEILISFPIEKYFSNMGLYETGILVFDDQIELPSVGPRLQIEEKDPESGRVVRKTEVYSGQLDRYPGLFELDMSVSAD